MWKKMNIVFFVVVLAVLAVAHHFYHENYDKKIVKPVAYQSLFSERVHNLVVESAEFADYANGKVAKVKFKGFSAYRYIFIPKDKVKSGSVVEIFKVNSGDIVSLMYHYGVGNEINLLQFDVKRLSDYTISEKEESLDRRIPVETVLEIKNLGGDFLDIHSFRKLFYDEF